MSALLGKLEGLGGTLALKGRQMLDTLFPPERRAELLARLKAYVLKNPKISAFLLTNFALTGGPLILFALFTLTVLVFAIVVALVVGLLAAVLFTLFAVGTALLVLFPTVFFTTLAASFVFLWGLGGYYILKWFNKGDGAEGGALGDKLNSLTGGKLNFVMDNAREAQIDGQFAEADGKKVEADSADNARKEQKADKEKKESSNGTPRKLNGSPKTPANPSDVKKHVETGTNGIKKNVNANGVSNAAGQVTKTANVGDTTNKVTKTANVDGVQSKVANSTGTVKGTLGGATGLV